ncbi:MAG: hypothetical protein QOI79_1887, partial [Mycobacterium sp.]|nr:hypothetical protein [Mycobacterium sp.]
CADSTLGSMAVFEVSLTLYSGPKADFTWEIFAISAVGAVSDAPLEHAATRQALPIATAIRIIRANLTHRPQPRKADTVFTNRSAANCVVSAGSGEPGSLISVVNAK